jgi:hypothetical protein
MSWFGNNIIKDSVKRARKNSWQYDIDKEYMLELWEAQEGKCAISGVSLQTSSWSQANKNPYRASLDRIDNSRGYVIGNVRLVTHWINNAKSTWSDVVFYEFMENTQLTKERTKHD